MAKTKELRLKTKRVKKDSLENHLKTADVTKAIEGLEESAYLICEMKDKERGFVFIQVKAEDLGFDGKNSLSNTDWGSFEHNCNEEAIYAMATDRSLAEGYFFIAPQNTTLKQLAVEPLFKNVTGSKLNLVLVRAQEDKNDLEIVEWAQEPVSLTAIEQAIYEPGTKIPRKDAAGLLALMRGQAQETPEAEVVQEPVDAPLEKSMFDLMTEDSLEEPDMDWGNATSFEEPTLEADGTEATQQLAAQDFHEEPAQTPTDTYEYEEEYDEGEEYDESFLNQNVFSQESYDVAAQEQDPFAELAGQTEIQAIEEGEVEEVDVETQEEEPEVYEMEEDGLSVSVAKAEDVAATIVGDGTYQIAITPQEADAYIRHMLQENPMGTDTSVPMDLTRPAAAFVAPLVVRYQDELKSIALNQLSQAKRIYWKTLKSEATEAERRARFERDRYIEERAQELNVIAEARTQEAAKDIEDRAEKASVDRQSYVAAAAKAAGAEWDAKYSAQMATIAQNITKEVETKNNDDRLRIQNEAQEVYGNTLKDGIEEARTHAQDACSRAWQKDAMRLDHIRLQAIAEISEKIQEGTAYDTLAADYDTLLKQFAQLRDETNRQIEDERKKAARTIADVQGETKRLVASAEDRQRTEAEKLSHQLALRDEEVSRLKEQMESQRKDYEDSAQKSSQRATDQAKTYQDQLERATSETAAVKEAAMRQTLMAVIATVVVLLCVMALVWLMVFAVAPAA